MPCLKMFFVLCASCLFLLIIAPVRAGQTTHEQTTCNEIGVEDSNEYIVPFTFYLSEEAVLNGREVSGNVDIVRAGEYVLVTNDGDMIRFKGIERDTGETNDADSDGPVSENGWTGVVFLCFGVIGVALIFHGNK